MGKSFAEKLSAALQKIDRPGSFCASGTAPLVLPGLDVRGVGQVGLPLSKSQASELKSVCQQAPYGKGEQTLVDTDVRRVWQLDSDRFKLTNPDWQRFLTETVATVQSELGLNDQKLEAHLYNLLLYEKGSFFKSHRDGEKLNRMVATLVLVLPSSHEGGELVVRHEGTEQVVQHGGADNQFRVQFAAFYADCEHEIRPVRKGHRLCLVYNLTLAKSKAKSGILAPRSGVHIADVAEILKGWPQDQSIKKLAVLLDHQYTASGLVCDALKGIDRAKAHVLFEAARQAGCQAYLALITLWQSGSAEGEYDEYDYYSRHRYGDDDESEENEESDIGAGEHTMGEVYDSSLTAENWTDVDGQSIPFGSIAIESAEVLPQDLLMEVNPEEDFEGYTGNAGMTLERWYRHAAVVLWPEKLHVDVLCEAGVEAAFGGLQKMVVDGKQAGTQHWLKLRPLCLKFAGMIVNQWPERSHAYDVRPESPEARALSVLAELEDSSLVAAFLRGPMLRDVALPSAGALSTIGTQFGWQTFQDELADIVDKTTTETILRNVAIVEELCLVKDKSSERRALCRMLAGRMLPGLAMMDQEEAQGGWRFTKTDRSAVLISLVKSLLAVKGFDELSRYIKHVIGHPKKYSLTDVQMPALEKLEPWLAKGEKVSCPPIKKWLAACRDELHNRVSNPPQEPGDWRRPATLSCHCQLCRELSQFLDNPKEQVHRFSVKKELRKHLHRSIDACGCDLDHQTDRRGSPQTLVCTKNLASYHKAVDAHEVDVAHLARIREMCEQLDVT